MSTTLSIEGAVETLTPEGELVGWARAADRAKLRVVVLRQGVAVAQGDATLPRPDLGGGHGYVLKLSASLHPAELVGGLVQVFAVRPDVPPHRLAVVGSLLTGTLHALLEEAMPRLTGEEATALARRLGSHPGVGAHVREPHSATAEAAATTAALAALPPNPKRGADGISQFGLPVGLVSPDGSIVTGHDGQLFLMEGSNGLIRQYAENPAGAVVQAVARGWHQLIAARAEACAAQGCGFLQLLIPDKTSGLPHLMPRAMPVPTPYWRALEALVAADAGLQERVLFLLKQLSALGAGGWPRTDTHLSSRGAYAVFAAACSAMAMPPPFADVRFDHAAVASGDVADRLLPGHKLLEEHADPAPALVAAWPAPKLVEEVDPGRHVGRRLVWRSPDAPLCSRVVVFGNSYFERGGAPRAISWWFARAFTEFHFCWLPELDEDYVRAVQPDWVVCQTVERFLPQVPAR
jgi:hypothetical protein